MIDQKYEISIWDYTPYSDAQFIEEKIAVIGSNTMDSQFRALEPQLIHNVNGSNTFSFKMYYSIIDNITGEEIKNPFLNLLVNERKIKVNWENVWYDLVIVDKQENSINHTISYKCDDAFIRELSKTGYNLTFDTELKNNIGNIEYLASQVLENTDWRIGDCDSLPQYIEEPVYEVTTSNTITINNTEIPGGSNILLFYSVNMNKTAEEGVDYCQFLYSGEEFKTDVNDMLVINGECYAVDVVWENITGGCQAKINNSVFFTLTTEEISHRYRAKRRVRSIKTVYSEVADQFVQVYEKDDKTYYKFIENKFVTPDMVTELIANGSDFKDFTGWKNPDYNLSIELNTEDIENFNLKSYLKLQIGLNLNQGLHNNANYLSQGIAQGEEFILECVTARANDTLNFDVPFLAYYNNTTYLPLVNTVFEGNDIISTRQIASEIVEGPTITNNKIKWILRATEPIPAGSLKSLLNPFGLFIQCNNEVKLESASFFRKVEGQKLNEDGTISSEKTIIYPGDYTSQGIANIMYTYFDAGATGTIDNLERIYSDIVDWTGPDAPTPIYNSNDEQVRTIKASKSNRFNILQTLAETFQCWMKIRVIHDDNGMISKDEDGLLQKFIDFKLEAGKDTGLAFEYGIDLQSITRSVKSDALATKVIVLANTNEYAKNGFCTIARADFNELKDTTLYNLEYYTESNLLNRESLYNDLYDGTNGFYSKIRKYNEQYLEAYEEYGNLLLAKEKNEALEKMYVAALNAANEQISQNEQDTSDISGQDSYANAIDYYNHLNIDYRQITEKPPHWAKRYGEFYYKDINNNYQPYTLAQAPTFVNDIYYKYNINTDKYELLSEEPSDWNSNYYSYYTRSNIYDKIDAKYIPWKEKKFYTYINENYEVLTSIPNNWSETCDQYYQDKYRKLSGNYPTWEKNKYYIFNGSEYTILTSKPSGWTNGGAIGSNEYYVKDGYEHITRAPYELNNNNISNIFYLDSLEEVASAPTWAESLYYSYNVEQKKFELTQIEPNDWSTNYINYYVRTQITTDKNDYWKWLSSNSEYQKYYFAKCLKTNYEYSLISAAPQFDSTNCYEYHENATYVKMQSLIKTHISLLAQRDNYSNLVDDLKNTINYQIRRIDELKSLYDAALVLKEQAVQNFENQYAPFIKEGAWQSSDYTDDNLYYLDALQVLHTSSRPQISYNLSVMRLSALEEYSSKIFQTGDLCYIIDRDYFGFLDDGITPYKEKVVVTEITSNFDNPSKDIIKIQNYKTRFEDLFKRITATAQNLQYASGDYARAADTINSVGEIKQGVIQKTLDANSTLVMKNVDQSVSWGGDGITITDTLDATKIMRITASGLTVSPDGGETWQNAISGEGISTNLLTAGKINSEEINIYKGSAPTFRLDGDGLNAYALNHSVANSSYGNVDLGKFVRFDQYGIYGIDIGEQQNEIKGFYPESENSIWENEYTKFALTWKGFLLQGGDGTGKVTLSDGGEDSTATLGLTVSAKENQSSDYTERVIVGKFIDEENNTVYGLNIKNAEGETILQTTNDGSLTISGMFGASGGTIGGWTISSGIETETLLIDSIQPLDWDNKWYDYYIKENEKNKKLLISKKPVWLENTYYTKINDNYILQASKPSNWDDGWYMYYTKLTNDIYTQLLVSEKPNYQANVYYRVTNTGKIYRGSTATGDYQELGGNGININNKFLVSPGGKIIANDGMIGGWGISEDGLYGQGLIRTGTDVTTPFSGGNGVLITPDGGIYVGNIQNAGGSNVSANFYITPDGKVRLTNSVTLIIGTNPDKQVVMEADGSGNGSFYFGGGVKIPAVFG